MNATAVSVTVPKPPEPSTTRALPLRFTGSAVDYFRIWIVNICLTLLTFGIFSAWAKVRKKRYFYSHTVLDGTPFQYLGQPIPILKGRIVATFLFGMWYVGTHYVIELLPVVGLIGFVLAPWVLVRSAAFNARYSAYRNITFRFDGTYWSAAKVLYGWLLVTLVTFGIGFSWWQQRLKQYQLTHLSYGEVHGEFSARGGQFFRTYALTGLLFMLGAVAIGGFSALVLAGGAGKIAYVVMFTVCIYAMYIAAFAYTRARIANLVWNHTLLGPLRFESRLRARGLLGLYLGNIVAILLSAGLLIPWATVRAHQYRAAHLSVTLDGNIEEFQGASGTNVQAVAAEVGEFFDFDLSI